MTINFTAFYLPISNVQQTLLLVLRKHYQEREKVGEEKVIIDNDRIEGYLIAFLPLTNKSKTDRTNLKSSLKRMSEKYLISQVRNTEDRWEISPLIRYVVNADFLDILLREYQKIASETQIITGEE